MMGSITPKGILTGLTVVFVALALMFDAAMILVCMGLETKGIYTVNDAFASFGFFVLGINVIGMALLFLPRKWFE